MPLAGDERLTEDRFQWTRHPLEAALDDSIFPDPADGIELAECVADVARQIAQQAIADADGGDADKTAEAEAYVAEGDVFLAGGRYKDATAAFKSAVAAAAAALARS